MLAPKVPAQDEDILPSVQAMQFIRWDTFHNIATARRFIQQQGWDLEHIDIPLDDPRLYKVEHHHAWLTGEAGQGQHAIIVDLSENIPSDLRDFILIQKAGRPYVRYYFSPDDTYYHFRAKQYLRELGVPYESGKELKAFRTASRSLIVYHPKNGRMFSLKPSTNATTQGTSDGQNRPVPTRFAYVARRLNDSFEKKAHLLKHLKIAWEPATVGLPAIDQSYIMRTMEEVNLGELYEMSGFVHHDRAEGERLAAKAGMSVTEFWKAAFYIKGQAMAELTLLLGFYATSNHGQNFRWQIGNDGKLTGKVVYLDLSDGRPIRAIFESYGEGDFLAQWTQHVGSTNRVVEAKEGLLFSYFYRGDWGEASEKFERQTLKGIIDRTSEITGIDRALLQKHFKPIKGFHEKQKYGWRLNINHPELKPHFERYLAGLQGRMLGARPGCGRLLKQMIAELP